MIDPVILPTLAFVVGLKWLLEAIKTGTGD